MYTLMHTIDYLRAENAYRAELIRRIHPRKGPREHRRVGAPVTPAAHEAGHYRRVYDALQLWIATILPLERPSYSNERMPQ
jgi:hypothetical protein